MSVGEFQISETQHALDLLNLYNVYICAKARQSTAMTTADCYTRDCFDVSMHWGIGSTVTKTGLYNRNVLTAAKPQGFGLGWGVKCSHLSLRPLEKPMKNTGQPSPWRNFSPSY